MRGPPGWMSQFRLMPPKRIVWFSLVLKSIRKVPLADVRKLAKGTFCDEVAPVYFEGALANSEA